MKKHVWRRSLAGLLAAALLTLPALAAEESAQPQLPDAWAVSALADSYALGLVDDNYTSYLKSPVTAEQLESMCGIVADKLALLELPQRPADTGSLVVDGTRGGVMNALYQQAAAYELPGVEEGAAALLSGLGVVQGDQGGNLALERTCTYQEAMVMAQRLILAAGGKGDQPEFDDAVTLCWKMPAGTEGELLGALRELSRGAAQIQVSPPEYAPF